MNNRTPLTEIWTHCVGSRVVVYQSSVTQIVRLALNRRVPFPSVVEGRKTQVWEEVGRKGESWDNDALWLEVGVSWDSEDSQRTWGKWDRGLRQRRVIKEIWERAKDKSTVIAARAKRGWRWCQSEQGQCLGARVWKTHPVNYNTMWTIPGWQGNLLRHYQCLFSLRFSLHPFSRKTSGLLVSGKFGVKCLKKTSHHAFLPPHSHPPLKQRSQSDFPRLILLTHMLHL